MNSIYSAYVPFINGYLNPSTDVTCKPWNNVVNAFFELNEDVKLVSKAALAETFSNASHPNYVRIHASKIDCYFEDFKVSAQSLTKMGFVCDVDFVDDNEGIRLSFDALRKLVYSKGDQSLIEAYSFIDKIYQTYCGYELAMMSRARCNTHYTFVERVGELTKSMQPHIVEKKGASKSMDNQPIVVCIRKGTLKSITGRLAKIKLECELNRKSSDAKSPKFKLIPNMPIYEGVLSNVDDELTTILEHINQMYAIPFHRNQLGKPESDGKMIEKITMAKHAIKVLSSCILIVMGLRPVLLTQSEELDSTDPEA